MFDQEVGRSENLKGSGTVGSDKRKGPFRKNETDKGTKKGIKAVLRCISRGLIGPISLLYLLITFSL